MVDDLIPNIQGEHSYAERPDKQSSVFMIIITGHKYDILRTTIARYMYVGKKSLAKFVQCSLHTYAHTHTNTHTRLTWLEDGKGL